MQEQREDMKTFSSVLSKKIEAEKVSIRQLQNQLDNLKYQTEKKEESKEYKLEHIENRFIEKREQLFNKESEVEKFEKIIDSSCISVSRIQF